MKKVKRRAAPPPPRRVKHKRHSHRKTPAKTSTALVAPAQAPTIIQRGRERTLRPEEIQLLQRTVAKGTSEDEFMLFMLICKKHRIDPFLKQIHCVMWPRTNQPAEMVLIMGIGGYRHLASRDHKDYGGTSKAEFVMSANLTPARRKIPESCTMKAFRIGGPTAEVEVFWDEFAPANLSDKRADFWNRMPRHMLAKCAESHALRKAFPDLSDIYTEEEMSGARADLTEGGREMFINGRQPNGTPGPKLQRQEIIDSKLDAGAAHGHVPGSTRAKEAEAQLQKVEQADERFAKAKPVAAKSERVKEEIVKKPAGEKMQGTLFRTVHGMTTGKVPYLDVEIGQGKWYRTYRTSLFESLDKGIANVIECFVVIKEGSPPNITGLIRIGKDRFEDDGKTRIPF